MDLRSAGRSPSVEIPSAAADRPSWSQVGVMAAVGFVLGVAWPHFAGVRLGPSVPEATPAPVSTSALAASDSAAASKAAPSESAPAIALAPSASVTPTPPPPAPAVATPSHGFVFACKTTDGTSLRGPECGGLPGLDGIVIPRLRKLADCPAASTVTGTLHLVVRVDFDHGLSAELGRGRGTSAPEPLLACAKASLAGASADNLRHDKARYSVAYTVDFGSAAAPEAESAAVSSAPPAANDAKSGAAQVEWEAAIIRDEPKTGKILARLPRGTAIELGTVKDGWYPVKYGDGFASQGWVYRGAVGR